MFNQSPLNYPYPSKRNCVYGKKGMVATSQPLAAQAGLDILKKGGNAIDAAIATAACLTVVEPTSNGIGSDAFALVWTKGELYGLNASGYAPSNISIEQLKALGYNEMPRFGMIPVTIPGTPKGWAKLSKRFGKLPLIDVLQPAIDYANHGYPISPTLGYHWENAFKIYQKNLKGPEFKNWFNTFAPLGRAPKIGEIWQSKDHAQTLKAIGETYADAFYKGNIADKIVDFSNKNNGFITKSDLINYEVDWVKPISIHYKDYDIWELPPNGQGLVALLALNILKNDTFETKDCTDTYHKQIEAMKLAFADGLAYITDPKYMKTSVEDLLSDTYAAQRRRLITDKALEPTPGMPPKSGTVYLATADEEGNMVSYIQSNYMGFGSGIVIPNTGIALQNRGHTFSLNPNDENALKPLKKTYHTIIPGFLTKDKQAVGPFGVMGGFMQPQGHMQVIMNSIDFKLNPQAALDAPRWQWIKGKSIAVEKTFDQQIIKDLILKGHDIKIDEQTSSFGRGQIIWRNPKTGVLVGGTESRTDGYIAVW